MKFNNDNLIIDPNDKILRVKCSDVSFPLSKEDKETALGLREYVYMSTFEDRLEELNLNPAVGIAAPQVGITKRICVVYIDFEDGEKTDLIMINPKIMAHSMEMVFLEGGEACLSIQDAHEGLVNRYAYIKVKYYDLEGKEHLIESEGFEAIAIQHEIDHLNGVLFYDHINKKEPFKVVENAFPL